jgi:hypothetical protein
MKGDIESWADGWDNSKNAIFSVEEADGYEQRPRLHWSEKFSGCLVRPLP